MRILIFILPILFNITATMSTVHAQMLEGEYYLTGVPEMASGFRFTPEGQFEFFFIYGAVERFAMGTYTIDGTTINLVSDKAPGKDFIIDKELKKSDHIVVRVIDKNTYLASYVKCLCSTGDGFREYYANEEGIIETGTNDCSKVYLQHEMYPDVPSLIRDEGGDNTYFEVRFAPEISKVSFQDIAFSIEGDTVSCPPNYLFPAENIRFVKSR